MAWSGITKVLLGCVSEQGRAVEIPNLAIFGPVLDKFTVMRDPLDKGPGCKQGLVRTIGGHPIIAVINEDFLTVSGAEIDYKSDKAVGVFNRHDRKEVIELFGS